LDVSEAQARAGALAEARRAAEQAALAKSHFLATMSHQIRTPMSTLLGMLERLAGSDLDAGQRQVLTTVGDAAQMLRQILDDVLHSQRLQPAPLQLRPTDLAALVRAVQQLLMPVAASRGLHLHSEIDPVRSGGRWPMGCACARSCSTWPAMHSSSPCREAWCCRSMCCSSAMAASGCACR
jgi:two-component system sensor histidine kinase EvgS